jgi:hypothetical protein
METRNSNIEKTTPSILFEYIRDILYDPGNASLDISELEDDYKAVGEGLKVMAKHLHQAMNFADALVRGELDAQIPPRENELAAPLKSLHALLRHIAWQTGQISKGDYWQCLDFMGDFSAEFNFMIKQLNHRQKMHGHEINLNKEKAFELEQNVKVFTSIADRMSQYVILLDSRDRKIIYINRSAKLLLDSDESFSAKLLEHLRAESKSMAETDNHMSDCSIKAKLMDADAAWQVCKYIHKTRESLRSLSSLFLRFAPGIS